MKKKTYLFCATVLVAACSLPGCNDDESAAPEKEILISVNAEDPATRAGIAGEQVDSLVFLGEDGSEALTLYEHVSQMTGFPEELATKGSTLTTANIAQFGLDGYLTTAITGKPTHYIDNGQVNKSGSAWTLYQTGTTPYNWVNGTSIAFWARAPYTQAVTVASGYGTMSFNYTLPEHQTDNADATRQQDIVAAYANASYNDTEAAGTPGMVNFTFGHALAAIRFDISNLTSGYTVTKVTLSGVNAGGSCTVTPPSTTGTAPTFAWTLGTTTGTYVQTLSASDFGTATVGGSNRTAVLKENGGKVFFIPPQTFGTGATATLTLSDGINTVDVTASLAGKTVAASNMYTYNVTATMTVWEYTLESLSNLVTYGHLAAPDFGTVTVNSYKTSNTSSTPIPVAWTIQYSANGTTWKNSLAETTGDKFGLTISAQDGDSNTITASVARAHTESEHQVSGGGVEDAAIATLRSRTLIGSSTNYFDLSKHPFYPPASVATSAEEAQETANCYVITAPGYYKFPLVYGNAIKNGATNYQSFWPQHGTEYETTGNNIAYYLRRFLQHNDQYITDPWLKNNGATVSDAVVLWQDAPYLLEDSDISISGDYVQFYIPEEHIRPGNAVLAVRNASGTILWSWHIWVTEKDLTPQPVTDWNGHSYQMMNYNLGWTDANGASSDKWDSWDLYVKVTQDESGFAQIFRVRQIGESIEVMENVGSNPFYQWGRKDPFIGANDNDNNKTMYSTAYNVNNFVSDATHTAFGNPPSGSIIGHSIQNPWKHYYNATSWDYTGNNARASYGNLWDAAFIPNDNNVRDNYATKIKSVYDPCPRGFAVTAGYSYTGFALSSATGWNYYASGQVNGTLLTAEKGYRFNTKNGDGKIFFPFCGARGGDGQTGIYDVTSLGYYWTSVCDPRTSTSGDNDRKAVFLYIAISTAEQNGLIRATHEQMKAAAYSIRPIRDREATPSQSSAASASFSGVPTVSHVLSW